MELFCILVVLVIIQYMYVLKLVHLCTKEKGEFNCM